MRSALLAVALLLALPLPARAGVVDVEMGTGSARVHTVPGKEASQTFAVGRFQVRVVVLQQKNARGHWQWHVRFEREKDGTTEVLASPAVVTAAGMEGIVETDSRLGPVKVHCRD